MRKVTRLNLPNCYLLSDAVAEVIVTTDVGPRVVHYGLVGGLNVLGECAEDVVSTEWGEFRPYGGHRLWTAPEAKPRSYAPDNGPVAFEAVGEHAIRLVPPAEKRSGVQKELEVALDGTGRVTLRHRITNLNSWRVEMGAWALTIMRGGGVVIIPQEPYGPHPQYLLPSRTLTLWPYTDMSDPRLKFGRKLILVKSDESASSPQKIGVANKLGWAAYLSGELLFVKCFDYTEGASYPDSGCNTEVFTAASFIELESLSPLKYLEPGETIEHVEHWQLFEGVKAYEDDESLESTLAPLIEQAMMFSL
ncbi:MAG TPA: hypothetical protein VGN95_12490 [Pyrinomonadaceae bacterium]|nr:hypothetical protein [Pyrinomonadaceae bacterium]